ncbi:MAG: hypothetical protein ACHQJ6_07755 [Candidatus Berkiellales bacterium]
MRSALFILLLLILPVCYGFDYRPDYNDGYYIHQHQPGYFFANINGRYYPDYQDPKFYRNLYCRHHHCRGKLYHPRIYKHVFYRYYTRDGISKEYYIP